MLCRALGYLYDVGELTKFSSLLYFYFTSDNTRWRPEITFVVCPSLSAIQMDLLQVSLLSSQDIEEKQGDITRHRAETERNYRRRERLVGLEN